MVATVSRGDQRARSINRVTCFWSCSNLQCLSTDWLHPEDGLCLADPDWVVWASQRQCWSTRASPGAGSGGGLPQPVNHSGLAGWDTTFPYPAHKGCRTAVPRTAGATGCARTQSPLPGETMAVPNLALHPYPGMMIFGSGHLVMPKCLAQSLDTGSPHGRLAAAPVGLSLGRRMPGDGGPALVSWGASFRL